MAVLKPDDKPRRGWRWTPLTALARLESGHTPSRKHPEYWGGDVPWIGIKDARDHHGGTVHETLEYTNALGIENSSARVLPANTVCLSRTASVGYVTVMGRDMATSQDFVNWVCGDALLPDFLKYLLLAQGDEIRRFASGSVHQTIYFPEVKAFHICHPPVAIQREICRSMERLWEQAEGLIACYEAKIADLDALRQSLLQKAFSGGLT
nr:restriction endonuclease subunit S [Rhodovulum tesquicola]